MCNNTSNGAVGKNKKKVVTGLCQFQNWIWNAQWCRTSLEKPFFHTERLTHGVCCTNSVYNEWCAFPWSLMHSPSCLRQWKGILNVSRAPLQWLSQTQHSSASTQRGKRGIRWRGKQKRRVGGFSVCPLFYVTTAFFSLSLSSLSCTA